MAIHELMVRIRLELRYLDSILSFCELTHELLLHDRQLIFKNLTTYYTFFGISFPSGPHRGV